MHAFFSRKGKAGPAFALAALVLAPLAFAGWQHYYPVQAASGWSYSVYRDDIPMVSALVLDRHGELIVSQEFKGQRGRVFTLQADGSRQNVATGLSKPDGLALFRGGLAISQEGGENPLLWWHDGRNESLLTGNRIEGMASDGRYLFAVEDENRGGRLLRYDADTKTTTTLRGELEAAEGLAVCADGTLFYTEKNRGWIKKYRPGGNDDIVARGLREPSFLLCTDAGLWITEDRTHRARLLLLDGAGALHTVLSHLRAPQTIIATRPTRFLLAEQGRGRILELNRSANEKP